ncbi:hypothetical protein ASAC_1170 [Acidilobus saccharovorans 345-15]|uniref:DUF1641 domain-containing protein n=1 Tax=Acidilobus saccharovorans (strain DSM 16705 / JCM 18335 / VKM B-2471 / 345-15) TaxID=666510 RepID=D9Q2N7_ACIS3|nr:DUF1641 domain-containing protein [Acidilobus saccharovorans]ADL19575.1 hypothetical protein ASAC_1170 [Acidilobus saccharovorans 345-15]
MAQVDRQAEALERLLDIASTLNELLSDEELLRAVARLLVTPETLLIIDRLPQIMQLLERLTRPETLEKLNAVADAIDSLDVGVLRSLASSLSAEAQANNLSDLMRLLGDRDVIKGLAIVLNVAKAIGAARPANPK